MGFLLGREREREREIKEREREREKERQKQFLGNLSQDNLQSVSRATHSPSLFPSHVQPSPKMDSDFFFHLLFEHDWITSVHNSTYHVEYDFFSDLSSTTTAWGFSSIASAN